MAQAQMRLIDESSEKKHTVNVEKIRERKTAELVIAMIGPVGSGCSRTASNIEQILKSEYGYDQVVIHKVSDVILRNAHLVGEGVPEDCKPEERVDHLQRAGNKLREKFEDEYLAAKVIEGIAIHRLEKDGFEKAEEGALVPMPLRHAHIIDSLKNPAELALLREVYGDILWAIGVFAPQEVRKERLRNLENWDETKLDILISKDSKQQEHHEQGVRDTFFQADFFLRNDGNNDEKLKKSISRCLEVIFGFPVHTPTKEESAMYAAYSAAAQSACLSRQVGASIVSETGELIGVGWNDVPKFKGGLYQEEDGEDDNRCYKWNQKQCHNDRKKDVLYSAIFDALKKKTGLLTAEANAQQIKEVLKETDIKQLIEYSRAVHAEMEAIISVARGNKTGLKGSTLYCTTFPCHSCARHILASGISKVIFIEPYPKSLATELHRDALSVNEEDVGKRLVLLQYEGVSPRNMLRLFKNNNAKRKDKVSGGLVDFDKKKAHPLGTISVDDFSTHEKRVVSHLQQLESTK